MKDNKIHRLIESQDPEGKEALCQKVSERTGIPYATQKQTKRTLNVKFLSIATVVVLVIFLAVILPIVLQNVPEQSYYFYTQDLWFDYIDQTLKEYSESTGNSILYIDWYENAQYYATKRFYYGTDPIVTTYLKETWINQYGNYVELIVVKNNITVYELDFGWDSAINTAVKNIPVYYTVSRQSSKAKFEYQGYKYYIYFLDTADEEILLSTIESMFR